MHNTCVNARFLFIFSEFLSGIHLYKEKDVNNESWSLIDIFDEPHPLTTVLLRCFGI
jgi:hypothetical protein